MRKNLAWKSTSEADAAKPHTKGYLNIVNNLNALLKVQRLHKLMLSNLPLRLASSCLVQTGWSCHLALLTQRPGSKLGRRWWSSMHSSASWDWNVYWMKMNEAIWIIYSTSELIHRRRTIHDVVWWDVLIAPGQINYEIWWWIAAAEMAPQDLSCSICSVQFSAQHNSMVGTKPTVMQKMITIQL